MIELEINDPQFASLLKALDNLDLKHMIDPVRKGIGESIIAKVSPYPMETTGYRRTGNLGNRWWYKLIHGGVKIGNAAVYAGWVHGEEQRSFHKARGWKRLLETAEKELTEIIKKVEQQIDKIWRRQ